MSKIEFKDSPEFAAGLLYGYGKGLEITSE